MMEGKLTGGQVVDLLVPDTTIKGQAPLHFMGTLPTPAALAVDEEIILEFIHGQYETYIIYEAGFFSQDLQKQYVKGQLKRAIGPVGNA